MNTGLIIAIVLAALALGGAIGLFVWSAGKERAQRRSNTEDRP